MVTRFPSGTPQSTSTDIFGGYPLRDLVAADYALTVTKAGYAGDSAPLTMAAGDLATRNTLITRRVGAEDPIDLYFSVVPNVPVWPLPIKAYQDSPGGGSPGQGKGG